MDSSNILDFISVRELEKSEEITERELAAEAAKTLQETVKKLKPYLRHIATPIYAPYVIKPPYLRWRWWRINSFRGIELVRFKHGVNGNPVLFIDEKGNFRRGFRGFGLSWLVDTDFYYANVNKDSDGWKDFPFGLIISSLEGIFQKAVSRREAALENLRAGTALLESVRQKFDI